MTIGIDLIRATDAKVKKYARYKKDPPTNDKWESHADDVVDGKVFYDDCDGYAMTTLELLERAGFPRWCLFRAGVSTTGGKTVDHMIGLVETAGEIWSVGDCNNEPAQLFGNRIHSYTLLQVSQMGKLGVEGLPLWERWEKQS